MRSMRSYFIEKILMVSKRHVNPHDLLREKYIQNRHDYVLPGHLQRKYGITKKQDSTMDIYTLKSKTPSQKVVLFLHGGAYVEQPLSWHWRFLHKLTKAISCEIVVPVYPKAPNHHCLEVIDPIVDIYTSLLLTHDPQDIILMGDSAGGGMALSVSQTLKQKGLVQPAHLILFSPWLDIALQDPTIANYVDVDPVLDWNVLITYGESYAFELDAQDYRVSPIYGDLHDLAPISLFVGTHELFLPDARRFKGLMDHEKIPFHYHEFAKMNHDFVLFPIPEAAKALAIIVETIQ